MHFYFPKYKTILALKIKLSLRLIVNIYYTSSTSMTSTAIATFERTVIEATIFSPAESLS